MERSNPTVVSRINDLEKRKAELFDAKGIVENKIFQKYFAEKIHKKNKSLKSAYSCANMYELKEVKGKHWGLQQFFECIEEIETELKYVLDELNKLQ